MNKWLLILACVVLTVRGQEEYRKEREEPQQPHPQSSQPSGFSKGISGNVTTLREKRMPDAKKSEDVSYGYAWNIGNGVSYMKMQVGKTSSPLQQQVFNSFQNGGHRYVPNQSDKTGYEKLHNDYLKMSQQIALQKNKNLILKPTENPRPFGMNKQEFNFKDKNIATFAINGEQNKGIDQTKMQEFNIKLRNAYDTFNKDIQISGWPQHQGYSLKELNMAQNLKTPQSSGKGVMPPANIENKPINGFEHSDEFLKNIRNQQRFPFAGNLDGIFKPVELSKHGSIFGGSDKGMEADFQGLKPEENTFKYVNVEGHEAETIPQNLNVQQIQNSGIDDAAFEYIGERIPKTQGNEQRTIPKELGRSKDGAWSTQNIFNNHQSNIYETENKHEEIKKTKDGETLQKTVPEIPQTPQIGFGNQESIFQINTESQEKQNNFPGVFNGMNPDMNQKLINDQVERIKEIQQKIIENHFPGAGIYDALDGNAQHGFHRLQLQENIDNWKPVEYNGGSEENRGRFEHALQNNQEVMNMNIPLGSSNVNFEPLGDQQRRKPFINNNAPSFNYMQNQFIEGRKLISGESTIGSQSQDEREREMAWRSQRNSETSSDQDHTDFQKDTYESQKLKTEDYMKGSDERKGREIKASFEHKGSVNLEHQDVSLDDHSKPHFFGSDGLEETKPTLIGSEYSQFHKYSHQEPQVKVITKAVPVHKELKIPVPQMVRHPILIPVPYKVLEPYPIKIPVPVTVEKTVEVPVEKVVHYPVEKPVPMKVVKEVRVPVPKPYPVKVPVYKIKYVHHNKKKHHE